MTRQGAVGRQGEILAQFEAAISGMRPREIQEALRQMLDARPAPVFEPAPEARVAHQAEGADWTGAVRTGADRPEAVRTGAGRAPSPSRRQPRRPDIVTYQVRVDLAGTEPPLWRRLDLASDLFLDELHEVIQTAFGWTDSHLHRFSAGLDFHDDGAEHYLCPDDTAEGEPGVPEEQVRLDELLAEAGDELFYAYDFGDGWEHALRLEAVLPRDCRAPRAVCTGGRRPGGGSAAGDGDGDGADLAGLPRPLTELADAVRTPSAK
ncbi:MAG TPA: plasmid pRiA4b ORF-3 family protein, partial [Streptosporangiaceae bacterium]|nr:plasmid pRiA4b ORF-3 family protein [Streptosporangiaceae bacterium]